MVNAGTIGTFTGGGGHAVVYDNTAGEALPENFVPNQMLYLSFDKANETVTGFADGVVNLPEDFSITAPSEWGDQAQMEVTILPGATVTVPWMFYKGTLLVEGEFLGRDGDRPVVYGTTPYYAINADAAFVRFILDTNDGGIVARMELPIVGDDDLGYVVERCMLAAARAVDDSYNALAALA